MFVHQIPAQRDPLQAFARASGPAALMRPDLSLHTKPAMARAPISLELLDSSLALGPAGRPRRFLRGSQWLGTADLAALQRRRLKTIVARAAETTYYAAVLRQAGIADPGAFEPHDLARLPLLDRETITQHGLDAFLRVDPAGLVAVSTSGSTGTPGRFYRSWKEEAAHSARWMRVYRAYGCGFRDRQLNVATASKPDRKGPVTWLRRAGVLPRVERVRSDAPPGEVLARLQALNPPILTGYAGAIEALADHVIETGAVVQPPRAVFCTAMEVTDRCLQLSERAFGAPAVDVYVTNEFGVIAWSCPVRRGVLHLNEDEMIVEVLDAEGKPVPAGTVGELVITSLCLTAMPLIRYRMGDMAALLSGRCPCGRGLALMSRVQGRTAHVIRRPDGSSIVTPAITRLIGQSGAYEWVRQYQVREEPGPRVRILLDVRRLPTEAQRHALLGSLESGVGPDFQVNLEFVNHIPPAPSGKLQYLVPLPSGRRTPSRRLAS
jgi:phenylacetate-CoA ligase